MDAKCLKSPELPLEGYVRTNLQRDVRVCDSYEDELIV
jgi:hypothetical protein